MFLELLLKIFHLFPDVLLDTLAYIVSRRGKPQVMDSRGFKYSKERDKKSKTHWVCTSKGASGCKGRFVTGNGRILRFTGEHNHVSTKIL